MPHVLILPADVRDADALTDLHLDAWEEVYGHLISAEILLGRRADRAGRVERWRENIASPEGRILLAWADSSSRLLGFVSAGPGRDEPHGELPDLEVWSLYVRAEVYGCGIGHALLDEAIGTAEAYLWVLDGNIRAISFYERQGFNFDACSKTGSVGVERRMVRWGSAVARVEECGT